MGKNGDWFSRQGLENHKKGMYDKESTCTKVMISAFFAFSACVYLVCGGISAERAFNAATINVDFKIEVGPGLDFNAYDTCLRPGFIFDPDED